MFSEQRLLLERPADPHGAGVIAGVALVVEDLLDAHRVDARAEPEQRERQQVVREARVDAGGEAARRRPSWQAFSSASTIAGGHAFG